MEDVPKFSNPDAYTFSSAVSIDIPTEIVSSTNNVKPGQQVYVLAGQATHGTNKEEFLLVWFGSVVGKGKTGRKLRVKHPNKSTVWEYSLDKVLLETQANFLEASEVLIPSDYSQGEETEEEPEEASKEKDSAPKLMKKRAAVCCSEARATTRRRAYQVVQHLGDSKRRPGVFFLGRGFQ